MRSAPGGPSWELWRREPHPALRAVVAGLWAGGGEPAGSRHRVLPNGELMMMFHVGPPQRAVESDGRPSEIALEAGFVAGLQERPYTIETPHRDTYVVAARLRPEAFAALHPSATAAELVGQVVEISSLLGRAPVSELCGRLGAVRDLGEALDRVEHWILGRLSSRRGPAEATSHARGLIARSGGGLRIEPLCRELGLSRRRLGELFRRDVGVPPKRLARIVRFRGALDHLRWHGSGEFARVALQAGYYDEPHLFRDFRELALLTPSDYLKARGDGLDGVDVVAG
jgi:AraC-like DNA-binding protein